MYNLTQTKLLAGISVPIIFLSLFIDLPKKNKTLYLFVAFALIIYLWINVILNIKNTFSINNNRSIKIHKLIFIFITLFFTYSMLYHALYNYDNNNFKFEDKYQNNTTFEEYFDMGYFNSKLVATFGYNNDISPGTRITKFFIMTQILLNIFLIFILLSKAI
jgi:preprotein translocase subunit SecG